jgi:hypothetical protein
MHVPSPLGPFITILCTPYIYSDQQHTVKIENGSSGLFLIDAFQVEQDPPWHDKGKKKRKTAQHPKSHLKEPEAHICPCRANRTYRNEAMQMHREFSLPPRRKNKSSPDNERKERKTIEKHIKGSTKAQQGKKPKQRSTTGKQFKDNVKEQCGKTGSIDSSLSRKNSFFSFCWFKIRAKRNNTHAHVYSLWTPNDNHPARPICPTQSGR